MDEKPTTAGPQVKPRGRWYQYSLRTLLIVVTLTGCAFAWLGIKVREAKRQEADVAAILMLHGRVVYDYEIDAHDDPLPNAVPPGPALLKSLLGDDCFISVVWVDFAGDPFGPGPDNAVADADVEHVREFTMLNRLKLGYSHVTDVGLEIVKGLPQLRMLDLTGTRVTDRGLDDLSLLTRLQWLDLGSTRITDAGLEKLKRLTQLTDLALNGTPITDAGLEDLKGLTKLRDLNLQNTHVTDAGVARLRQALPYCKIER